MKCPLGCKNPDCNTCGFSKEGLCDFPYIGAEKAQVIGKEAEDALPTE